MKLYIFKSETKRGLRGFASDPSGEQLPAGVGPWSAIGVVPASANPPHGLERSTIEKAIEESGYQLWRMKAAATPTA